MEHLHIGKIIAKLRKRASMTQAALAKALDVSDKAVSKWESGLGFPDIKILPSIADAFGVTVDYLLRGDKKSIVVAGNMLVDVVKSISSYPKKSMLTEILDISYAVGGCAPNTAINLSKIDRNVPVRAIGKVGLDENGRYVISQLQKYGIDTSKVKYSSKSETSFCDVMSVPSGERTFFYRKGANSEFSPMDIDVDSLDCVLLHIGYLLLLDGFDKENAVYGTEMAKFLHDVQNKGIKTSIDVVSNNDADFGKKVIPALKYCSYVIINEIECCSVFNMQAYKDDGSLDTKNIKIAMKKMEEAGVLDMVIVHCKEVAFLYNVKTKRFTKVSSLNIPKDKIKGNVGAGDAFCAGCLYGIYNGYQDEQILEFASAAAACNLFEVNSVDGMKSKPEILKMCEEYERLKL